MKQRKTKLLQLRANYWRWKCKELESCLDKSRQQRRDGFREHMKLIRLMNKATFLQRVKYLFTKKLK